MTNEEMFIKLYKELEFVLDAKYQMKPFDYETNDLCPKDDQSKMRFIRSIRNAMQHNEYIFDGQAAIQISEITIKELERIIDDVKNPLTARNIMQTSVVSCTYHARVKDVVKKMRERNISNVPILDNKWVVGVFSENTIFTKLAKDEMMSLKDDHMISDYQDYVGIFDNHVEFYEFISQTEEVRMLKEKYHPTKLGQKRLAMLFVTANGLPDEKLLGVITPWDLI